MNLKEFLAHNSLSNVWLDPEVSQEEFLTAVQYCAHHLEAQSSNRIILFAESTYLFGIGFFGALVAQKQIILPPNSQPGTITELKEDADLIVSGEELNSFAIPQNRNDNHQLEFDDSKENIWLYTSGSTGSAKKIPKNFTQLNREIDTLEEIFGARLKDATCLSTVTHQHLYGLLFRFLWPLKYGRPILTSTIQFPEELLAKAQKNRSYYIVSSPAQLKRMPHLIEVGKLNAPAIFSSGGLLDAQSARHFENACGVPPIEVYGCSETGGIAFRTQLLAHENSYWSLFPEVKVVARGEENALYVASPWTPQGKEIACGDSGKVISGGHLELWGRLDRVVKIEEKRVSLDDMELRLRGHPYVKDALVVLLQDESEGGRSFMGCAIVLSATGQAAFNTNATRWSFLQEFRAYLGQFFEVVTIPKRWRIVPELPKNQLGKIVRSEVLRLFKDGPKDMSNGKCIIDPIVVDAKVEENRADLLLEVPKDLAYLPGHFPEQPVVPGFVQIDWVMKLALQYLKLESSIDKMEMVKFRDVLLPSAKCRLELRWHPEKNLLKFELRQEERAYSSGKIIFKNPA